MEQPRLTGSDEPLIGPVSRRVVATTVIAAGFASPFGVFARRQGDRDAIRRVNGKTPWREIGDTTLEEFQQEFAAFESPMLAEAGAIYRRVRGHSSLFLAMSFVEKKHDTYLDVIPARFHNAMAMKAGDGSGRWKRYPRYEAGAADWVKRLLSPTGPYADTVSLRDLLMVYAPPFENDTNRYVRIVAERINDFPRLPPAPKEDAARPKKERRDRTDARARRPITVQVDQVVDEPAAAAGLDEEAGDSPATDLESG